MNSNDFISQLTTEYDFVALLSDKNDGRILRLRHKTLEREMILREYKRPVPAYDILKSIEHENLPRIYDTLYFDDGQIILEEYIDAVSVGDVIEIGKYTYGGARFGAISYTIKKRAPARSGNRVFHHSKPFFTVPDLEQFPIQ